MAQLRRYIPPLDPEAQTSEYDAIRAYKTIRSQDEAFCSTMDQAIKLGLEQPPMIGVDTRPCTKKPRLVHIGKRTQEHK